MIVGKRYARCRRSLGNHFNQRLQKVQRYENHPNHFRPKQLDDFKHFSQPGKCSTRLHSSLGLVGSFILERRVPFELTLLKLEVKYYSVRNR